MSSLRGLSPEEKKQALLRISQFILREPSANVRESLYKKLLMTGIYLLGKSKKEVADILDIIEKQFFGVKLESSIAEECLSQLVKEQIVEIEYGEYLLGEKKRSQIEDQAKHALNVISRTETKFISIIKQKIGSEIPEGSLEVVKDSFYQLIVQLVSRHIVNTARLLVKGTIAHIPLSTGEGVVNVSTIRIIDTKLREAVKTTLMEMMRDPDDEFVEYLFYMRQNFLCLEVLNLDPDCRTLEREEFSKKRLILDTNILLSLTLQNEFHAQTIKLIENTRKLGCSIYVTRRTLGEFGEVLEKSKRILEQLKATGRQLSGVTNAFIRTYAGLILQGKPLASSEFFDQFSNMDSLLTSFGVMVLEGKHEEIEELPKYKDLILEVKRCFEAFRLRKKTDDVAEHDAFHLLLVKTLRSPEEDTILGPDVWFLSSDLTLSCTDKFTNSEFTFSDNTSPVMIADIWNEIISPFLIGIVKEKDLVEALKSFLTSEFAPISEGLDADILSRLEIDWTEYDWLEIDEIREITKQGFVLDYLSRRERLAKTGDSESLEQLRSEFNVNFSKLIGRISSRKIEHINAELRSKKDETEKLKFSVKALEQKRNDLWQKLISERILRLRMRYVAGIAGICLLVVVVGLILMMKETASWQITTTYVTCLIVGAVLLLMAIKPRQVKANLGVNRGA